MNLLVCSSAAKIPLLNMAKIALKKVATGAQVIAGDGNDNVVSRYLADAFWHMPSTIDSNLKQLLDGCKERNIQFILPTRDGELLFWAKHKACFAKQGISVLISPLPAIERCLDKLLFYRFAMQNQLPAIPTLMRPSPTIEHWVVKERFGAGSTSIGLCLSSNDAMVHGKTLHQPIYQPFIKGQEISIDAWLNQQGKLKGHICRSRLKVVHGESQISQTIQLPEFDEIIRQSLQTLQVSGPVVMQAIISIDKSLHIIECNSRFGGASSLGIIAGVDSLYWSLAESLGIDISQLPFNPNLIPIKQVRYAQDLYL